MQLLLNATHSFAVFIITICKKKITSWEEVGIICIWGFSF